MKRIAKLFVAMAAMGATIVPGAPAHAQLGPLVAGGQLLANGTPMTLNLSPGVYSITTIGTYTYFGGDTVTPADDAPADGECSLDVNDAWTDPIDDVAIAFGLYPAGLSQWHRYRYGYSLTYGFYNTGFPPQDDTLDVYINGKPVAWVPTFPTPVDTGQNLDLGCNVNTHQYDTVVVSDGTPIDVRIFDTNYADNAGSVTLQVGKVLG